MKLINPSSPFNKFYIKFFIVLLCLGNFLGIFNALEPLLAFTHISKGNSDWLYAALNLLLTVVLLLGIFFHGFGYVLLCMYLIVFAADQLMAAEHITAAYVAMLSIVGLIIGSPFIEIVFSKRKGAAVLRSKGTSFSRSLRRGVIFAKNKTIPSARLGKVSFWLAMSPWFVILPGWIGIPGFG